MYVHIGKYMKTGFLLGAGFTYDISNGKFLLLSQVNKDITKVVDSEIVELCKFETDDFEICLTRLDIELRHTFVGKAKFDEKCGESLVFKKKLSENRVKVLNFLAEVFSMQGKEIEFNDKAKKFADKVLKNDDIIFTTNYDCYLENLLGPKQWSFHGGYGKRLRWSFIREENSKLRNIKFFKIHGSPAFKIVPQSPEGKEDVEVVVTKEEFPEFYSQLGWLDAKGPYLMLPSFIKPVEFSAISDLYQEAIEEMKSIERLIIIGSRLREEDYMLWFILSYFRHNKDFKIYIVDPRADEIKEKLVNALMFSEGGINILQGKFSDKIDELIKISQQ